MLLFDHNCGLVCVSFLFVLSFKFLVGLRENKI